MLIHVRQIARASLALVLGASMIAGSPTASRADPVNALDYLDAVRLKSTDLPGAIKAFRSLCFDAKPPSGWSRRSCTDLGLTLLKKGPLQDIPGAFRTFSFACELYGDYELDRPCFLAGGLAVKNADAIAVSPENAVDLFAEGCEGSKYGSVVNLDDKAAMNCVRMAEAHQAGYGVPQDTDAARRYRERACEAQQGDACFVLNVDSLEIFNAWMSYALDKDRTFQERGAENVRLGVRKITSDMKRFCGFRSSPSSDACFWAGFMIETQKTLLGNRALYSHRSGAELIKRSCALGNQRACEWPERD